MIDVFEPGIHSEINCENQENKFTFVGYPRKFIFVPLT